MNALRLLMQQHDRVEGLLVDLQQASERGGEARRQALAQFARVLRTHLDLEEVHFYSATSGRLILVSADRFLDEHKRLRGLLTALEAEAEAGSPSYADRLHDMHELLVQHVSDEEIELFPEIKRRFDVDELDEIGERIELALESGAAPLPPGELSAKE